MTSPVSRDRLDAIRARHVHDVDLGRWDEDEGDLLDAADYALDADDRIAALEAEVERLRWLDVTAERDALAATIAKVRAAVEESRHSGTCDYWFHRECDCRRGAQLAILDGEAQ